MPVLVPVPGRSINRGSFDIHRAVGPTQVLWQPTTTMVTAVTFSPDARLIVAGLINGTCTFYLTEGMRYLTQVCVVAPAVVLL